ncbi:MAG: ABC transporter substrate-binding protein [Proteobacteria bacterium]|nr:ABC transporter substrate-binding protein [Pseudomonadota bacterium]MCP4921042.1 ABC transporter substrate-binding protein [Pseudomonadota bacterium]
MWFLLLACSGELDTPSEPELTPLRVGWQTTWATQGQLAVLLQTTGLLAEQGFDATFVGFSYGGPLNEGALAGEVDVLFTADQPAIALGTKDASWGIVGRLMYNRVGTFVPVESTVQVPADLAGKRVAIPFGAAAHRETLAALDGVEVEVVNLGLEEIVALVGAGATDGSWGSIDAGSAWDPAFANLEESGQVRTIASGTVTSVVVMDDDYVAAHPGADERFMQALDGAYGLYKADPAAANTAFKDASRLPFDVAVLDRAASVEPNLTGPTRLTLSDEDKANLQSAADFMLSAELLREPVSVETLLR